jgi:hypothetical protein
MAILSWYYCLRITFISLIKQNSHQYIALNVVIEVVSEVS